jgi:hypothetical protein
MRRREPTHEYVSNHEGSQARLSWRRSCRRDDQERQLFAGLFKNAMRASTSFLSPSKSRAICS